MKFSTYITKRGPLPREHKNPEHSLKLARIARDLPQNYGMVYCTGCKWYLAYPLRDDGINVLNDKAFQHMLVGENSHFTDLLEGRAVIDVDLVDGGEAYLRARLDAVAATTTKPRPRFLSLLKELPA